MSEELEEQKKIEVNVPGNGNTIVAHADNVSVNVPGKRGTCWRDHTANRNGIIR